MPDRRRRIRILLMHAIILPTLLFVLNFFALAPLPREPGAGIGTPWFVLLGVAAAAGFAAGFWLRSGQGEKSDKHP